MGKFVESTREKTGRSIEEAASRIGMSAEDWQQVEAGTLLPNTREQVYLLADALDVEWDAMARGGAVVPECLGRNVGAGTQNRISSPSEEGEEDRNQES